MSEHEDPEITDGSTDYYDILGVDSQANNKAIMAAYRKLSLKYHPDKNPDNPNAAKMFQAITKARAVLLDAPTRAKFDAAIKLKRQRTARHATMNVKRRKMKDELDIKEDIGRTKFYQDKHLQEARESYIHKLREEGVRLAEEAAISQQKRQAVNSSTEPALASDGSHGIEDAITRSIRVKWKMKHQVLTREDLETLFVPCGQVETIVMNKKGKGSALLTFVHSGSVAHALRLASTLPYNTTVTVLGRDVLGSTEPAQLTKPQVVSSNGPNLESTLGDSPVDLDAYEREMFSKMEQK